MSTCTVCGFDAASPFKFCPECGAPSEADVRQQRKVVTVLFCDVVGSTVLGENLDPEALRLLLARYFDRMKRIVERHGGVVEKFIGDAVMAVFGLPVVHEDDAMRALRAASEMRDAFTELGVEGRIGVNTGEVVAGTEERLATGDAVNVAARFQQAAEPGEIVLGETTLKLAGDDVEAEPCEPLHLKGKAEPVPAWRLVSVSSETRERRFDSSLVGRREELGVLAAAWERVQAENACELITIVGSAGVGKSRLVTEFLAGADPAVVRGRCLSYGEDITYWPAVEVLKQLDAHRNGPELDPAASQALSVLLGQEGTSSTDEFAWAFRKLLESVARERPLVAVFDDIQWAADAFLDLLENLAVLSAGAPILLLCMARPELLDRREGWGGVIRLEPLPPEDAEELMNARIGARELAGGARERILQAAAGNPLFVEEMAAMLEQSEDGDVSVPPTIHALLAARLDQLGRDERTVLEHGAIEGEIFHRGGVQALTPEESRLTTRLTALVRRELVRPDKAVIVGDDAYRFRHLLIRDAAYEATPKARRAELHEAFAAWLEQHASSLVELDEVVGHHLEQAARYRQELGETDGHVCELAAQAGERLRLAGERAIDRKDVRAGMTLLERASALLPEERLDVPLEIYLAWARFNNGQAGEVTRGLRRAADRQAAAGNRLAELALRLEQVNYDAVFEPTREAEQRIRALVAENLPVFEAAEDDWGLNVAYGSLVVAEDLNGRSKARLLEAAERLADVARRNGSRVFVDWGVQQAIIARRYGPTPVQECLDWIDVHPEAERGSLASAQRPMLLAMLGHFAEANALLAALWERQTQLGAVRSQALTGLYRAEVASLEGAWARAADAMREGLEKLELSGDHGNRMWFRCKNAEAVHRLGRDDEAEDWLERARETPSDEMIPRILWPQVQATVLARRGEADRAELLAREAVALASETDMLNLRGEAMLAVVEVRQAAGDDARREIEEALALFERKGNVVMVERTRSLLTDQSIKLP
jgi:class 3 adenylate cyclase